MAPSMGALTRTNALGMLTATVHSNVPDAFREARCSSYHYPYKVGIEDRREHDGGIAGIRKVVHRPGEQLAAGAIVGTSTSCYPRPVGKGIEGLASNSGARSGSWLYASIWARAASRRTMAAVQSLPCGIIRADHQSPGLDETTARRKMERVPVRPIGTSGTPVCAATTKAPIRKGRSPGARPKVPSGKKSIERP